MIRTITRFFLTITVFSLALSTLLPATMALAQPLTISESGPYIAVDPTVTTTTSEWRVETTLTPGSNSTATPANGSVVFGYADAHNYYYANVAAGTGTGLNGIYRVSNGSRSLLASYNASVTAGHSYKLEARYKSGEVKFYLNGVYIAKASNIIANNTKVGAGTVNGNAIVTSAQLTTSVTQSLALALEGSAPNPEPGTIPPSVSITAPTNGASISGIQSITAAAQDDEGIASVQFHIDGTNLGAADTSAPYTTTWDTTTAAEGSHTITAIATDTDGAITTSAPVTVTVDNQPASPVAGDFTIEASSPNAGIDTNATTSGSEWKIESQATPIAGSDTTPANFSLIFGYTDPANFYYANFAAAGAHGLGGIYKVENGSATKLMGHATLVTPGQTYDAEVRYKDGDIRLYLNNTYIIKVENITFTGAKVGVAAFDSSASFRDTSLVKGSTTPLSLTPTALTIAPPTPDPNQSLPTPSNPVRTPSTGRQVAVSTSSELQNAIVNAQPGDTIHMADGVYQSSMLVGNYTGSFAITADGTAENPITLTGSPNAIIDGNGTGGRYGLYLKGADHWNLVGFSVSNAAKGIVQDGSNHIFYENMTVTNVGQEAIHFRAFSSDNVVKNSTISATGRSSEQFGEGVYIGSASGANWGIHSGGNPDTSNRNIVIGNTFTDFKAEGIDIKEGSSQNYIAHNTFEGSSLSGQNSADSWIDVKGNYNLIEYNTGTNTLANGFEVHAVDAVPGWGANNLFRNNTAIMNTSGYGFYISFNALQAGNTIECNNIVTGTTSSYANVACRP